MQNPKNDIFQELKVYVINQESLGAVRKKLMSYCLKSV